MVLACGAVPNRLVGVDTGAFTFTSTEAGVLVLPNENMLLPLVVSAGFSVDVVEVDGADTSANGLPTGNEDVAAGGITEAVLLGVEKLNNPAFGGATLWKGSVLGQRYGRSAHPFGSASGLSAAGWEKKVYKAISSRPKTYRTKEDSPVDRNWTKHQTKTPAPLAAPSCRPG